jgi:hypothetical protein
VHGREFPTSTDYWDGNWLRVTGYCQGSGSVVRIHGSLIRLTEISGLLRGCEALYERLDGHASLDCIEPYLKIDLVAQTKGHIAIAIEITPDQLTESHRFTSAFDQTFLPPIIGACRAILDKYPIHEGANAHA